MCKKPRSAAGGSEAWGGSFGTLAPRVCLLPLMFCGFAEFYGLPKLGGSALLKRAAPSQTPWPIVRSYSHELAQWLYALFACFRPRVFSFLVLLVLF